MKIIIIASFAPSIINFRKELILALREHAEIIVLAPWENEKTTNAIKALGVTYKPIFFSSHSANPFKDIDATYRLTKLLKTLSPDIVFSYTIKPIIWGAFAAKKAKVKKIYSMVTGLGYAFTDTNTLKHKVIQKIVIFLYKKAFHYNEAIFFQNPDDKAFFQTLKIISPNKKTIVLNGSGVNLTHYDFSVPVITPVRFLLIARLLKDKGIIEYASAAKEIKMKYPSTEFHMVGYIDHNPAAISQQLLNEWIEEQRIIFHGRLEDVRPIIRLCNVYVLPSSYREGTPRSILEAMSIGRPIITTNTPGCRETVIDGYNGYLVPIKDVKALANAMEKFIHQPERIEEMGINSRKLAEEKYEVSAVNKVILDNIF